MAHHEIKNTKDGPEQQLESYSRQEWDKIPLPEAQIQNDLICFLKTVHFLNISCSLWSIVNKIRAYEISKSLHFTQNLSFFWNCVREFIQWFLFPLMEVFEK